MPPEPAVKSHLIFPLYRPGKYNYNDRLEHLSIIAPWPLPDARPIPPHGHTLLPTHQHEMMTTHYRPYKCTVQIALPSDQYAQHLKDIISVDQEISDKVVKSFSVVMDSMSTCTKDADICDGERDGVKNDDGMRVLQM
jgi:hypothetical protein